MSDRVRLEGEAVLVLVGAAGSGKTTWAEASFPGMVLSSDRLRGAVGRGEWDQEASADAFAILETMLDLRLGRGLTTVLDTTGLGRDDRRRWAAKARASGLEAVAVVFDTEAAVCKQRNRDRRDPVPVRVLEQQLRAVRSAIDELADDGFDRVVIAPPADVVRGPLASEATGRAATAQVRAPAALRFGLVISRFDWPDDEIASRIVDLAVAAEEAGFSTVWVMDHLRQIPQVGRHWEPMPESYTTLAYLAGATSTIGLGALVTQVGFRNIAHLGKIIATLDVLSGGRARCGLGAGWFEEEATAFGFRFPGAAERLDALEDALQALPLVWGPGGKAFAGRTFELKDAMSYPRPLQERIPILVGGSGEQRTLKLVARYADACNLMGTPEDVAAKVEVLHRHCKTVGRDPAEIAVTHLGSAVAVGEHAEIDLVAEALRATGQTPGEFAVANHVGTVDDLTGHYRRYVDVGVSEVMVSVPGLTPDRIEPFASLIERFRTG